MPRAYLSSSFMNELTADPKRQVDYHDQHTIGLAVRISPAAKKTFCVFYRIGRRLRRRANAAIGDFRPQDIPRTVGMRLGAEGVPRLTIAKVLNHAEAELASGYDRSGRDLEKQKALDAWGRRLMMIASDPEECDASV